MGWVKSGFHSYCQPRRKKVSPAKHFIFSRLVAQRAESKTQ
jgi:hypothetical protein